jgi:putative heme-binding domain-containing protein
MKPGLSRRASWLANLGVIFISLLVHGQKTTARVPTGHSPRVPRGAQIFASTCASCHGFDGKGTQRAPNIATNPVVQKLSQKQLTEILVTGVPGTGMPSFRSLGAGSIRAVAEYVRSIEDKGGSGPLPGNPKRGEAIFFGKGECSNCHMAAGRGGFIAPELTTYGQTHSAEKIKSAITNPAEREMAKSMVSVVTTHGDEYKGMVRNEDNFSVQLQLIDGTFRFFPKTDLKSLQPAPSIMPADYLSRLTEVELNDIASYLLSLGDPAPRAKTRKYDDE